MPWWFTVPKVIFGEDALNELTELKGKKAFIVTDPNINELGFPEKVCDLLVSEQWEAAIWDGAEPDPRVSVVENAADAMRRFGPDWIMTVGGGSVIDTAKAAWILYEHPDTDLAAVTPLEPLDLRNRSRLLCIPTTAGTGSEATKAVVIRDDDTGRKFATNNNELVPDVAILDPSFVRGLPKDLTAYTGLDSLTHAIEAYISNWKNDYSDACAIQSLRIIFQWLPKSVANLEDEQAREKMLVAANLAGMAFSNSQVCLAHSLGHCMGSVLEIHHGMAVGIALPYTIEYNSFENPDTAEMYAELATFIDIEEQDDGAAALALAQKIRELQKEIGAPISLKEAGVKKKQLEDGLDKLVEFTMMDSSITMNPRDIGSEGIRRMYHYMYEGKSIDF